MFVTRNKIIEAKQFWADDDPEGWPEGVVSDESATPVYTIETTTDPLDGSEPATVNTQIYSSNWVVYDNTIIVCSNSEFFNDYTETEGW